MELESVHLIALAFTALVILFADHHGFEYFRGTRETLSPHFVTWSHRGVWAGLTVLVLSGLFMVIPAWDYYKSDMAFYVKMGFVLVLTMNGYAIQKLSHMSTTTPFRSLPKEMQHTLMVSGALSAMGWVGAAVIGFFFL
jgi:hypothetical protein